MSTCSVMVPAASPGAVASRLAIDWRVWVTPKHKVLSGMQQVVVPGVVTAQHAPKPTVPEAPLGPVVGIMCLLVSDCQLATQHSTRQHDGARRRTWAHRRQEPLRRRSGIVRVGTKRLYTSCAAERAIITGVIAQHTIFVVVNTSQTGALRNGGG